MPNRVLFVTGKLAEPLLRRTLAEAQLGFEQEVAVMKITVAALMTTEWIARLLEPPPGTDPILVPALVQGDTAVIEERFGIRAKKGPRNLRQIPEHYGLASLRQDYGAYDIEILAEVNDAPMLDLDEILRRAHYYAESGTEIIDVGCMPGRPFPALAEVVGALCSEGLRVSIDSFDEDEIRSLHGQIRDRNYRIFTNTGRIYIFNAEHFIAGTEINEIFEQLDVQEATHAFYLGKELMKAKLAISLGKSYRQEGHLSWGYLAPPEEEDGEHARAARRESRLRVARERADRRRAAQRQRDEG